MTPFLRFAVEQLRPCAVDCAHPLHLHLAKAHGLTPDEVLWHSMLYMGFYNEASAWVAFNTCDPWSVPPRLPMEKNRRNLYGDHAAHFTDLAARVAEHGGAYRWLTSGFGDDRRENWRVLYATLRGVYGNGRWAAFNTADHLHKVAALPVEPTDVGNAGSSAPADALERLYGGRAGDPRTRVTQPVPVLDAWAADALVAVREATHGVVPAYLCRLDGVDFGVLESLLCDWSGVDRGRYYAGRNVDRMLGRIHKVIRATGELKMMGPLWDARAAVFPAATLGELNGWLGIDKVRIGHYQRTGEVLAADERR